MHSFKNKYQQKRKVHKMFEYFYGNETEQYIFFSVPLLLFTADEFKSITCESKLLYSFLLDRTALSRKHGWFDEDGKIFVYFKQTEAMERLNIGKDKANKIFHELDNIGLIKRVKQGQGKPTKIYVKNFTKHIENGSDILTSENRKSEKIGTEVLTSEKPKSEIFEAEVRHETEVLTSENQKSGQLKSRSLNCGKTEVIPISQTNISILSESYLSNQSDCSIKPKSEPKSEPRSKSDKIDRIDFQKTLFQVKEQIDYDYLADNYDKSQIDEITELITWCMCTPESTLKVNGINLDIELVRSKCEQLNSEHIAYIVDCLNANTTEIKNRRNYLLTCIYNAPGTMDGYYDNKVKHDLYGSKP